MKKTIPFLVMAFIMLVAGCTSESEYFEEEKKKIITFLVKGDFEIEEAVPLTRALVSAGKEMTDLWIIDADLNGEILQTVHLQNAESDISSPSLLLSYGTHRLYFCVSRGAEPALDGYMLRWEKVLDTFWASKPLTVNNDTERTQSIELERIVTRLKITIKDGVPGGVSSFNVVTKIAKEIDLRTGVGTLEDSAVSFAMTKEDEGKTGIEYGVFSLCPTKEEWHANVSMRYDEREAETVIDVPFKMNRETKMKGMMNSISGSFSILLNTVWDESVEKDF